MKTNIPLAVLIEALECLNIAKKDPPGGPLMPVDQWMRLLHVSGQLDHYVKEALAGVAVEVQAVNAEFAGLRESIGAAA